MNHYKILEYIEDGKSYYADWFNSLDTIPAVRVDKHVRRMEQGNMGDSKGVGRGVFELRIYFGPGYRVYYGKDRGQLIILLGGGSKRHQPKDITKAIYRWQAYKKRRK